MDDMGLRGSPESVIESIRFTRTKLWGGCPRYRYDITWAGPPGEFGPPRKSVDWCDSPLCPFADHRWRMHDDVRPDVKETAWVPSVATPLAVAYLLVAYPMGELPRMEARIGICAQWEDRAYGNRGNPDGPRRLFTGRYFAESGPGIYPAPIIDITQEGNSHG